MITIVGAGPAGSYLGYLLAKQGKDVTIIEEHEHIGRPVQCTGIVTHSIEKFFKLPSKVIATRMNRVKVVTKNRTLETPIDEIVMWRNLFDEFVADLAQKEGAKILTSHQFLSTDGKTVLVKDRKKDAIKEIKSEAIVGADGPKSTVAKSAGIPYNNRFYIGMQAKVKMKMDVEMFETHFGSDFPGFFGWAVPESDGIVRLGIGATENAQNIFYRFLEKMTGNREICCWESGIIPIYNPWQRIQKGNIYLIGDAATQVKATTGGGIIPSMKAAHTLSDCIIHKRNYNMAYRMESGKELWLHLKLRNMLNKFSDSDYDRLADVMGNEKVKAHLQKYDRDTPIPLIAGLPFKDPRILLFAKTLF